MAQKGGKRPGAGRPKAGPKFGRWTSVEDALPEPFDSVLVYCYYDLAGDWDTGMGFMSYEDWNVYDPNIECGLATSEGGLEVTHWMPLPEPPDAE